MKLYIYESKKEVSISAIFEGAKVSNVHLEPDAICIRTIEGLDMNDCLRQHHVLMGWEPYKPIKEWKKS